MSIPDSRAAKYDSSIILKDNDKNDGDIISLSCDFYSYDYEYDRMYSFGENIVVDDDIVVSYENVGDFTTNIRYILTDVYNNTISTEMIELTIEE